uniref:Uncharacterized protein n=1 Tax=Lepeophtheirus salmonis TaxID=72036 RepID=A0A0K2UYD5_LEPSM
MFLGFFPLLFHQLTLKQIFNNFLLVRKMSIKIILSKVTNKVLNDIYC